MRDIPCEDFEACGTPGVSGAETRENRDTVFGLLEVLPVVAFGDSLGDRVAGEAGDVMDVELGHEPLPMVVHRFKAQAQFGGDLFVAVAFGNQLEHLHFA